MLKYILPVICILLSIGSYAQDGKRSKFSAGLNIGYKTANGLGFIISYHANPVVQVDFMAGYTRYNGGKFGAGGKIYPFKPGKVNPFVSACFSISTGANVETSTRFTQKEHYRTFSNQYVISGLGITMHGEETSHSLQVGYSFILTDGLANVVPPVQSIQNKERVQNSIKGGIMATYNLFIFFNKPRKR